MADKAIKDEVSSLRDELLNIKNELSKNGLVVQGGGGSAPYTDGKTCTEDYCRSFQFIDSELKELKNEFDEISEQALEDLKEELESQINSFG